MEYEKGIEKVESPLGEEETSEKEIEPEKEEPEEIMVSNHNRKSKFEKSDKHEIFELKRKFCKYYLKNSIKNDIKTQVCKHKTHNILSKRHKKEKVQYVICRSSKNNKITT
ncbi:hypothetical protein TNCV_1339101 [Trichonephila clavipes]|nr:hypothetical protein TNCV_1339101 [Trichonephila clavipes]